MWEDVKIGKEEEGFPLILGRRVDVGEELTNVNAQSLIFHNGSKFTSSLNTLENDPKGKCRNEAQNYGG